MNPYNGFSGKQREAKLRAQHERERLGLPGHPPGPCSICGDNNAPLEVHDEDYSEPYVWEPPAQYAVCHQCHSRIHSRFRNPELWEAHKAHVSRGGYASETSEFEALRAAMLRNDTAELRQLRFRALTGNEWWQKLTGKS